ncbi:unnamed protein product [Acanthoscelides obtectus]|uniref:MADF domain-containing protein n=1 Tax=Acanthoscelides obtectus TaxID=200917 RepID=A0A9P0PH19_ACAOB|nr:unnamed protein product [Acanthoscelides obtectus]CAK1627796.1 hypothetical protein AOBTE_LOCUS4829 [Acanthoscelides obtectus]
MFSRGALHFVEKKLDVDKMMSEIKKHPILWNINTEDYRDQMKTNPCWEEIIKAFSSEEELSLQDRKKIRDVLHKGWIEIRDGFARKGKSGDGASKEAPDMYPQKFGLLGDTVAPKRTAGSLEQTIIVISDDEQGEGEYEGDDQQDGIQESTSVPPIHSSASNIPHTKVGKKRQHPVEDRSLRLLNRFEKRSKIYKAKETVENDNRRFLLSLVQNLAALPRLLNTPCKVEIMNCIHKYENMNLQLTSNLSRVESHPSQQQNNPPR